MNSKTHANLPDDVPILITDLLMPEREGGYAKGAETRETILRTALSILIEEGYPAMSMRRVASACGIKFGNLTYHFRSREDLVRELFDAVIRSYEVEFVAIAQMPGAPPEDRLRRLCILILDDIRTKKTTHFFPEIWALANHDSFVFERVQDLYVRARAPILDIIQEMRTDLSTEDQEVLALFISGSMEGMTMFAGHEKPFEPRMKQIEAIAVESFIHLVRNYGAERAGA